MCCERDKQTQSLNLALLLGKAAVDAAAALDVWPEPHVGPLPEGRAFAAQDTATNNTGQFEYEECENILAQDTQPGPHTDEVPLVDQVKG